MNANHPVSTVLFLVLVTFLPSMATAQTLVDASAFQAPKKQTYTLDDGDTLGVFVEGVVGEARSMPPVHQPEPGSDLPPALGFPTLVLHDGTIRLPIVDPVSVRGLTISQVESLLKKTYRDGDRPIITDRSRVIVSLIRKRTVNVLVVRGDQSQAQSRFQGGNRSAVSSRSDRSGRIVNLQLPVGDNDLLNAMMQSGGLPGVNARDQLQVFRSVPATGLAAGSFPRTGRGSSTQRRSFTQNVPLRTGASQRSPFPRSNARLNDGDIVSIASKPTEVFYTGGLLGGGEFLIPRDRPLSLTDAIALAGGIPQSRGGGVLPTETPRSLTVLRRSGGGQISQRFDLNGGFSQQASQTQVRAGDYLILDFSPAQRVKNVGIGAFNTFGVRQLFGN